MRKIVLMVLASCALAAMAPASALAHGHRHHHRRHHSRVHFRAFGDFSQSGSTSSGSTSSGQSAGTVQSFTNNVLTIAMSNGSTVSGTVTSATEIECQASSTSDSSGWQSHDQSGGGDSSSGSGDSSQGDDQGEGTDSSSQNCDTSSLTPGATVQAAELEVSSAGAAWDKVDLMSTSSTASQSSSSSQPCDN